MVDGKLRLRDDEWVLTCLRDGAGSESKDSVLFLQLFHQLDKSSVKTARNNNVMVPTPTLPTVHNLGVCELPPRTLPPGALPLTQQGLLVAPSLRKRQGRGALSQECRLPMPTSEDDIVQSDSRRQAQRLILTGVHTENPCQAAGLSPRGAIHVVNPNCCGMFLQ